jgi:hypothetical protein
MKNSKIEYDFFDKELVEKIGFQNLVNLNFGNKLNEYSFFKNITNLDLSLLRNYVYKNKNKDLIWCEKIIRFIEIRMSSIDERLKLNFKTTSERLLFKEHLISFLLEVFYYTRDIRFLNTALKLLKTKRLSNNLTCITYNNALVSFLLKKIA